MRKGTRADDQLRPLRLTPGYVQRVPGSALVEQGDTRVVCTATVEERVPPFLKNKNRGWITAEYSMLPGSGGGERLARERNKVHHRHGEIQRFIGRALRTVIDLAAIGEMTITLDADVIQADGSTRCASLNGCLLALILALRHLVFEQKIADFPPIRLLAAVSIGSEGGRMLADLDYEEDARADMDLNLVSNEQDAIIELQAFTEKEPVTPAHFQEMVQLGLRKNLEIIGLQKTLLAEKGLPMFTT